MGDLSEHFSKAEFACPCCGQAVVDPELVRGLEALRNLVDAPIRILSGYRCAAHNAEVGGRPDSQHLTGRAADIQVKGWTSTGLYIAAERVPEFKSGGIGIYPESSILHVDVRAHAARWGRWQDKYLTVFDALAARARWIRGEG
jgi:uncharacterized protein YcbK (DUF882 family)